MKTYNVTVNGKVYTVSVEEVNGAAPVQAPVAAPAPVQAPVAAPAPAPTQTTAPAPAQAPASAGEAKVTVSAPMPGTIISVNVTVGQKVEKGSVLCLLEAMKMENEIMAPEAGTVASIAVSKGASVNAGDLLITIA